MSWNHDIWREIGRVIEEYFLRFGSTLERFRDIYDWHTGKSGNYCKTRVEDSLQCRCASWGGSGSCSSPGSTLDHHPQRVHTSQWEVQPNLTSSKPSEGKRSTRSRGLLQCLSKLSGPLFSYSWGNETVRISECRLWPLGSLEQWIPMQGHHMWFSNENCEKEVFNVILHWQPIPEGGLLCGEQGPGTRTNMRQSHQLHWRKCLWLLFSCDQAHLQPEHRLCEIPGNERCLHSETFRLKFLLFLRNIARGTTDPGYWVHNSNHPNSRSMLIVESTLSTWSALVKLLFAFGYFYKTQEVVFLVFVSPYFS